MIDYDDTSRCPVGAGCATYGSSTDLPAATADTGSRIWVSARTHLRAAPRDRREPSPLRRGACPRQDSNLRPRDSEIVSRSGTGECRAMPLSWTDSSGAYATCGVVPGRSR
jgi:hypothetical protein